VGNNCLENRLFLYITPIIKYGDILFFILKKLSNLIGLTIVTLIILGDVNA